jgi:hypothetical protein
MISDMFDVSTVTRSVDAIINLDAPANLVAKYADLVYTANPLLLDINLAGFLVLLGICDRMQSQSIEKMLIQSLHNSAPDDPWGVFVLASQRDDLLLAKTALEAMSTPSAKAPRNPAKDFPGKMPLEFYEVTPSYLRELVARRLWKPYSHKDEWKLQDWVTVAIEFPPAQIGKCECLYSHW